MLAQPDILSVKKAVTFLKQKKLDEIIQNGKNQVMKKQLEKKPSEYINFSWVVSKCSTASRRAEYVDKLKQYIQIDQERER